MLKLTINKAGTGTGTVSSAPDGIDCGSTCQATFAAGTAVTLTAKPDANQSFLGWDSTVCTGNGAYVFPLTGNTVVHASFSPAPNIVFTTSSTQTGALGGLTGADSICANLAADAGLPGKYVGVPARRAMQLQLELACVFAGVAEARKAALARRWDLGRRRAAAAGRRHAGACGARCARLRINSSCPSAW
jgi:hypothetical protein